MQLNIPVCVWMFFCSGIVLLFQQLELEPGECSALIVSLSALVFGGKSIYLMLTTGELSGIGLVVLTLGVCNFIWTPIQVMVQFVDRVFS
ncbi:hypothetical protein IQ235_05630 [Oscillatoriales cyanobacterium LEGE 11467]|uniref:Uncharacterized protein n=1 Tax=Zarconia navalis LEGE 11467 TaxID=1828826 RepID=A0A928VU30_9CYAN|nr:hypothetical protein [Zarconia navalis]MBE9040272.1 hypothetical protein [Zarconia navalis LEGE 11467]